MSDAGGKNMMMNGDFLAHISPYSQQAREAARRIGLQHRNRKELKKGDQRALLKDR